MGPNGPACWSIFKPRLTKSYISLNSLSDISDDRKTNRKGPKQLQFYERAGNLIKSGGLGLVKKLAVLIISVYVKSRIIVQNRGVR